MQSQFTYNAPPSLFAENKNIYIHNIETIVLKDINTAGFSNLSFTITNTSNSLATINVIKIYGSNDGINYFTINSNALSSLSIGSTTNYQFSAVAIFIRITATSNGTSNVDCYLVGVPNGILTSELPSGSVPANRQIIAGTGLSGGGDLTADRTLQLNSTQVVMLSLPGQQTGTINVSGNVEGDGGFSIESLPSTGGTTTINSAPITLSGTYWNGATSINNATILTQVIDSTSPRSHLDISVNGQSYGLYSDGKILLADGSSAAVSSASHGSIRYNNTSKFFEVSENAGSYDGLVQLSATQTLLNKTITTPTITSPAISAPTFSGSSTFSGSVLANGGFQPHRTAVADTNYATSATDIIIAYTSISTARVMTGTVAGTATNPVMLFIKDESGSSSPINTISFTPASGTIDGASTKIIINAAYGYARVYCNGTNFFTF